MGPFPTEFDEEFSNKVRTLGGEYGATTGRPRRCGWFDAVVVKLAVRVNGLSRLAVTKLDVLDTLEEIKICTGYRHGGKVYQNYPAEIWVQDGLEPIYESHPGWLSSTKEAKTFSDLPQKAQSYLQRISALTGTKIEIISVGSDRNQTIFLN